MKFSAGDYQSGRNLSETVAGSPTTKRAKPKLALENAAKRTLEPAALQLMIFFCLFVFFGKEAIMADFFVQSVRYLIDLLQAKIFS